MKKIKYLVLAALALTGLAACTSDNIADETTPEEKFKDGAYMTINVVTDNSGTRAASLDFKNGSPEESAVKSVLCLFYDNGGQYLAFRKFNPGQNSTGTSTLDDNNADEQPSGTVSDGSANTVEKIVGATIVLKDKQILARKMLVIVNAPTSISYDTKTLDEMKATLADYSSSNSATDGFLMTSSTYQNGVTTVCEQSFDDTYFFPTAAGAKTKPVEAWVERVLARVDVDCSAVTINNTGIQVYNDGTTIPANVTVHPVVLSIEGAATDVVTTTIVSNLFKSIKGLPGSNFNTAWTQDWNSKNNHRCYWAVTPSTVNPDVQGAADNVQNKPFPTALNPATQTNSGNTYNFGKKSIYVQENTNTSNTTKVIVYAQLKDENGNAIDLVEVKGNRYTYKVYCQMVAFKLNEWCTANGVQPMFDAAALNDADNKFNCNRSSITDNNEQWNCVLSLAQGVTLPTVANMTAKQVGDALQTVCDGQVGMRWQTGKCYYFAEILSDLQNTKDERLPGVVRNHIYNVQINSISGLGTPVFDPSDPEDIDPKKPTDKTWYVAAKINTLKWRVVNQSVSLGD